MRYVKKGAIKEMREENWTESFREKWRGLWADERPLRTRMLISALCAFAFVFTFIVFGPMELYAGNTDDMPFSFSALAPVLALAGGWIFLFLMGVLFVLQGKIFDYAVSLLSAVTLAGYIQGNMLNVDHGTLNGDAVAWVNYKWPMIASLVFWFLVIVIVLALMYFSRSLWTNAVKFVSALLAIVQIVACISLFITSDIMGNQKQTEYLSTDGIYELAPKNNVVFFLLDRCDRVFMDDLLARRPEWGEQLNGFTNYHDFTGSFSRTYPSVAYLLTGFQDENTVPFQVSKNKYLQKAWESSTFLPEIHQSGVQIGLYSGSSLYGEMVNMEGKIDNIGTSEILINKVEILKKMMYLSAYRYAPEALKPYFQIYTGELQEAVTVMQEDLYKCDDPEFWSNYRSNGLTVNEDLNGAFRFYHMQGAHPPSNMNANAEFDTSHKVDGWDAQLEGNMKMILQYIEELKELGIYDETTVIISTDHAVDYTGYPNYQYLSELDSPRVLPLLIKPAGADLSIPMQTSNKQICQDNLRVSIADYFGLDAEKYGRSIESIGEDEPMTRRFGMMLYDEALKVRDTNLGVYEITGDSNDFSNWKQLELIPLK